jgi:hypothetical protein
LIPKEKIIRRGKTFFTHSKKKVVRKGKIKYPPPKSCVKVIFKRLLNATSQ